MKPLLLSASSISKSFEGVSALRRASFDLREGEVHALVGENGAGKSTLIKIISGAEQSDEGSLSVAGRTVPHMTPALARSLGIAVIYQQASLFPHLTVAENLALALETGSVFRRVDWAARHRHALELLEDAGAAIDPERLAATLSMPEQQMVEIAKAIGADAKVVIMDEPTASLMDHEVERLFRVIDRLRAQGGGIIYISHRLEELFAVSDRITVLRDGDVIVTCDTADIDRPTLIQTMVGRELAEIGTRPLRAPGEVALELRRVSNRSLGIHDVSLDVRRGEVLGIAGLVGSGRTELAETLFGLEPADEDEGEILVDGAVVRIESPSQAVRLGIGYVPEDRRQHGVVLEMPIASNASLASLGTISSHGLIDRALERRSAEGYVERLRIKTSSVSSDVGVLSGGNQQKVALARWLSIEPRILILDEPTQGVDVGAKAEIHLLIHELAGRGLAIVMISSELPEVLAMSDRVAVMHAGTISGVLSRDEATQDKILALALERRPGGIPVVFTFKRARSREMSIASAIAALALVLAVAAPGYFSTENLSDLFLASLPVLLVALGMTLVVITGEIDISVGATFAICAVVAGGLAKAGAPVLLAAAAACVLGAIFGSLNGVLVAYVGIPSIVATLATMTALRDGLRWVTEGAWVQDLPTTFQWMGLTQRQFPFLATAVTVLLTIALAWTLRYVAVGRAIYATGSNPGAARLAGLNTSAVKWVAFAGLGTLTGLAAVLNAVRFNQIPSNAGIGLEMKVIAAVVVGGASVAGGTGSVTGTVLGVVLLSAIGPALTYLGVSAYWERAVQGGIILAAVAADGLRHPLFKRMTARLAPSGDGPASRARGVA